MMELWESLTFGERVLIATSGGIIGLWVMVPVGAMVLRWLMRRARAKELRGTYSHYVTFYDGARVQPYEAPKPVPYGSKPGPDRLERLADQVDELRARVEALEAWPPTEDKQ